jgi:hypothetical protein
MIYTTLNKIREKEPCKSGWEKLLTAVKKTKTDDEPLALITILDSNGLDDCLWCLRTVPEYDRKWRLFSVWCARKVQHLMTDPRSVMAIDIAEKYALGEATDKELAAAGTAAGAAAWAVAGTAAGAAGTAAGAARDAAWAAAGAARDAQKTELRRILSED